MIIEAILQGMKTELHEIRQVTVSRSGPLPDARELQSYEQVHPGAANRILSMAEREQRHRHDMEERIVTQPFRLARIGQGCGLAAVLLLGALAAYLAYLGEGGLAAVVAALDIAAIVTVFVTGQAAARRSDEDDSEATEEPSEVNQE
ncbi:hypothetical protein CFP65_1198 [Kitasatospora sp. MMS16-BH015]|uniref:DUF2335 domain-containing protein n=1 Tax=Kitasatospora sp. MMS16-BH015 TaxID=2018025 RepID=UPI000CA17EE5|nr:DUF2335 domain-containing protein [Kitasatospora sp. MMS16-BH015]AUG76102.1 hypothetical protein CFP65_1198 [Kitasatospora sp. MMS16-BH015]